MTVSLTVTYPATDGTTFDFDYYTTTHKALVEEHFGAHMQGHSITKGLAGGPDVPSPFYAIYTATFKDMDALQAALGAGAPVLADIPNYTNTQPQMTIGEVL